MTAAESDLVSDFFDPEAAASAGALHGQRVGVLPSGVLVLATAKSVEPDVRSTLLIVPGLVRIDVWRFEENLSVIPRNLSPYPVAHTFDERTRGGYQNDDAEIKREGLSPIELWAVFHTPRGPLMFLALVTCVNDEDVNCHHFLAKGELWAEGMEHRRHITLVSSDEGGEQPEPDAGDAPGA